MEIKNEFQEGRKPSRFVTPRFVRVLHAIGLSDLSDDEVRQYAETYHIHYGSSALIMKTLHRIGLTDLTDEEVARYIENSKRK